jgi:hypothetical protein
MNATLLSSVPHHHHIIETHIVERALWDIQITRYCACTPSELSLCITYAERLQWPLLQLSYGTMVCIV